MSDNVKRRTYEPERDSREIHAYIRKTLTLRALESDRSAVEGLRKEYSRSDMTADEYEQWLQNIIDGEY